MLLMPNAYPKTDAPLRPTPAVEDADWRSVLASAIRDPAELCRSLGLPESTGWASGQIYADGTVWPCCVRADDMGNLRDAGYDLGAIWFSERADQVRRSIYAKECYCPLANAAYTNMLHHLPTLAKVGWRVLFG